MSDNNEALAPEYKDILWRLNDIADMLTKEGVGGQRIYGCDEFSAPVVNLKAAIAKIEALSSRPEVVPEGYSLVPIVASAAVLDRAVSFALNVSLSREYTWSDYMRDLWAQMIADHIPGATKMVVSQADPAPAASPVVPEWKILGCVSEVTSPDRAVIALQNSFPNLQVGDIVKLHPAAYGSIPSADLSGGDQK